MIFNVVLCHASLPVFGDNMHCQCSVLLNIGLFSQCYVYSLIRLFFDNRLIFGKGERPVIENIGDQFTRPKEFKTRDVELSHCDLGLESTRVNVLMYYSLT